MPIISTIGRRDPRVRCFLGAMYAILLIGAASMIYPLLLMVSGSVKSETDYVWMTPIPAYLWDDNILWMKYVESKYETVPDAETAYQRPVGSWRSLRPVDLENIDHTIVDEFIAFRNETDWPATWYTLGHTRYIDLLAKNARAFRQLAQQTYDDNVSRYSDAVGVRYSTWSQVGPPKPPYAARRFGFPDAANYRLYDALKADRPASDWIVVNLDGDYWRNYLQPIWADINAYNAAHGTSHQSYRDVLLPASPPAPGPQRDDWNRYVRTMLGLPFIRVAPQFTDQYQRFLRERYIGKIADLNQLWQTSFTDFDEIALPSQVPASARARVDLAQFIKDESACPISALSVFGPRQAFEQFVAEHRDVRIEDITPLSLPLRVVDIADFHQNKPSLRWEFITRNYKAVLDYLLLNGNGIRNTVIFCSLMVISSLIINPLAAYALSRYRPPTTYTILLFCMCTMAFPPEVTMIPQFLLLKRFPLGALVIGAVAALLAAWALQRMSPRWPDWSKGVLAGTAGIVAGVWLTPFLISVEYREVSLLNTFWALVLPGMANGFSIFLLKGFFDSLPQELYEAAELDGAGEWTKFWTITMSLSKPILAVLALNAFTAAYSEFMMALVLIPDQKMWTLMIWLFQMQSWAHPTIVYASLVIAAIPTLLIFLFCQNIIMRGIVVPVEK